jgi:hypothetical protein
MDDQYSYSDRMESEPTKTKRQRKFNREFQKNEVIRFLVRKEPLGYIEEPLLLDELFEEGEVEGYSAFLYKAKDDREYDEGFGPSILVKLGVDETVWKRSRNKWNPFEKIRTIANPNETDFAVVWDRNKLNSYYVTERMYYYLDKEKHREKYTDVRAKLYITRLHQKGDRIFLLQFIGERLSDEEQEAQKRMQKQKEEKKARQIEQKKKDKFKEATSFTPSVGSTPAGTNAPSLGGFDINRLISPYQQPIAPANVRGTYPPWPLNNPGKHEFEIKVPTPIKAQTQGPVPAGQQLPNFSQFTSTVDQVAQMQQQQMVQQFQHQLHLSQPYQFPAQTPSYSQSTSPGSSAMYPSFNPSPPFLMPQPSAAPQLPPITTTPFNMIGNSQFRPPSWPTYGVVTTPAGSFLSPYQVPAPQNSLKRRSADIDSPRTRDTATPTDLSSPSSPSTYDYDAPPLKRRSIEPPQENRRPASWSSSSTTSSAPSYFPNLPPLASTSTAMQIESSSNPSMHHIPSMPVQFPQGFVFKPDQFPQYQHQQ